MAIMINFQCISCGQIVDEILDLLEDDSLTDRKCQTCKKGVVDEQ